MIKHGETHELKRIPYHAIVSFEIMLGINTYSQLWNRITTEMSLFFNIVRARSRYLKKKKAKTMLKHSFSLYFNSLCEKKQLIKTRKLQIHPCILVKFGFKQNNLTEKWKGIASKSSCTDGIATKNQCWNFQLKPMMSETSRTRQ